MLGCSFLIMSGIMKSAGDLRSQRQSKAKQSLGVAQVAMGKAHCDYCENRRSRRWGGGKIPQVEATYRKSQLWKVLPTIQLNVTGILWMRAALYKFNKDFKLLLQSSHDELQTTFFFFIYQFTVTERPSQVAFN